MMKYVLVFVIAMFNFSLNGQSFKAVYKKSVNLNNANFSFLTKEKKEKLSQVSGTYLLNYCQGKSQYLYQSFESKNGSFNISKLMEIAIYKDHSVDSLYQIDILNDSNVGHKSEMIESSEWEITEDIVTINNFKCRKAIYYNNGNRVVAYFTSEIEVSEGPFVYSGLPGLIIRIERASEIIELIDIEIIRDCTTVQLPANTTLVSEQDFKDYRSKKMTGFAK